MNATSLASTLDDVTPNYGFQKPTPGDDDDVWGFKLNSNFDNLDALIADLDSRFGTTTDDLQAQVTRIKGRMFDPLDFGAKYDNVADDGPAIQRAIGAAQIFGGIVGIRAPGNPIHIGTGVILANGVELVALAGRNFTAFNATPGGPSGWGRYGVYFRCTDLVNPCIKAQGHGCGIRNINIIYDQPVPTGTFTPTIFPYAIDVICNYATIEGVDIIGASHGIRIAYNPGGGTRVTLRDITIDSFYVGIYTNKCNDILTLINVSIRGMYYVTSAAVVAFREANQIGWDCHYTDNPWVFGLQFFQCKIGMLLTNDTSTTATHSLYNAEMFGVAFNLCRQAIVTAAADTIATGIWTNCAAQSDTETATTERLFEFLSNAVDFTFQGLYLLAGGEGMRIASGSVVQVNGLRVRNWSASIAGQNCFSVLAGGALVLGSRRVTQQGPVPGQFIGGGGVVASANYGTWTPFSDFTQRTVALNGTDQSANNVDWQATPIANGQRQMRISGTVNVSVAVAAGTFRLFLQNFPEITATAIDCTTTGSKPFNSNWLELTAANNIVGRLMVNGTTGATVQFGSVTVEGR